MRQPTVAGDIDVTFSALCFGPVAPHGFTCCGKLHIPFMGIAIVGRSSVGWPLLPFISKAIEVAVIRTSGKRRTRVVVPRRNESIYVSLVWKSNQPCVAKTAADRMDDLPRCNPVCSQVRQHSMFAIGNLPY